jgi:hypothetical protein
MTITTTLHTLTILLCATSVCLGQPAEKTLVKSFNLQGSSAIALDVHGDVNVQPWTNEVLRVQMTVTLPTGTAAMLKSLVESGRYNLKSSLKDNVLQITLPNMEREVLFKGKMLEETLSFIVYAPENTTVQLGEGATTDKKGVVNTF